MTTISLGPKADLVYGRSGSTKTSQVGHLAEYIHEKYGKRTRLVSADPGGWQSIEHLVQAGLVIPQHLSLMTPNPLETIVRASQGYWPDATGKWVKGPMPDDVGAVAFEGLTTFSTLIMSNLVGREDISIPGTPKDSFVKDGSIKWGFSGMAHYGFIQQRMYEIATHSNHLPVHKVLWTAHETDAKDSKKKPIYGPNIIGEAMTESSGAWFGAMLHMQLVEKTATVPDPTDAKKTISVIRREPIMFLREHVDPTDPYKVPYMAKPRGPSNMWQEWPDWMVPNIGDFYRKLDAMGEKALAAIKTKGQSK